jgi:outer membrane protein assembly factor BamB
VADDGTLYVSSNSGCVYEIAPDGLLRRSYSVSPTDTCPAILPDGTLALGSGILDLSSGGFQGFWMTDQTASFASPAAGSDGTMYAAAWDTPGLYAFSPNSGTHKWSFVPESQGRAFAGPVVGDNGLVYQTFLDDSRLYAVDAKTGVVAWTVDLADPCIVSDRSLLGDESWSEPVLGPDGTIYAGLDDPFIRAVDPANGRIKWVARAGSGGGFTMATDKLGYLYAADDNGCLYVMNAQGRLVSVFESNTPLSCPVIAADGLLLVVGAKGRSLDDASDVLYGIAADPACPSPVLGPPHL